MPPTVTVSFRAGIGARPSVTLSTAAGYFTVAVSRDNETLGRAPIPARNETVTVK